MAGLPLDCMYLKQDYFWGGLSHSILFLLQRYLHNKLDLQQHSQYELLVVITTILNFSFGLQLLLLIKN